MISVIYKVDEVESVSVGFGGSVWPKEPLTAPAGTDQRGQTLWQTDLAVCVFSCGFILWSVVNTPAIANFEVGSDISSLLS